MQSPIFVTKLMNSSIMQWRLMAHTTTVMLDSRRSRETSSCSKTVLHAPRTRHNQTFWTGDTRIHAPAVAPTVQILTQWTTRYGTKCSSGSTRQKSEWTVVASYRCVTCGMAWDTDDATDEWRKRLHACIRAKGGHFEHLLLFKGTHTITWVC